MGQKNRGSGPKAASNQGELAGLVQEARAYRPVRERGVDETVQAWFRLYHSVVLLAAATDPPRGHPLNAQDG